MPITPILTARLFPWTPLLPRTTDPTSKPLSRNNSYQRSKPQKVYRKASEREGDRPEGGRRSTRASMPQACPTHAARRCPNRDLNTHWERLLYTEKSDNFPRLLFVSLSIKIAAGGNDHEEKHK